jgi:simple sugar transport system ATP-binding protein
MADFLELRGISKRFGGVQALADVDLAIAAGEVHCLVGENGSGKSTLIKIISGVQPPDPGGEIVVAGQAHSSLTPIQSTQLGIAVIYQDLALFPNVTVAENIAVTQHLGRPHLVRRARLRATAADIMGRLGITLEPDALVGDLPIASRQLVAICRAMAGEARLLIMDEPTASLTRQEVERLLALTLDLKREGVTVVFVSHRLGEVMEIAERVTVLRDGRKVGTFDAADMNDRRLGVLMTGKEFHYEPRKPDPSGAETVLSVRGLTRAGEYRDVSFDVRAGEILGITGLLGAGRTELALSLFGVTAPESGQIRLGGEALRLTSNRDAIARGIAYVPEDRLALGLVLEQPVGTNLVVTVLRQLARGLGLIPAAVREAAVRYWIRELAIKAPVPANPVRTLSGGNQQRVVLSKWLAREPRLLILDSPTVGVDISAKDGIYEIVARLAALGMAVILISDEIPEVYYHCHRVLVMREGRMTRSVVPHETTEAELEEAVHA